MSLGTIAQAIQDTGFFTTIRESGLLYPVIMSSHLSSIALFGGMILITDLRILGFAMKDTTVTDIVTQLRPWKRLGFVIMIGCGICLGGAKLSQYYDNPYFDLEDDAAGVGGRTRTGVPQERLSQHRSAGPCSANAARGKDSGNPLHVSLAGDYVLRTLDRLFRSAGRASESFTGSNRSRYSEVVSSLFTTAHFNSQRQTGRQGQRPHADVRRGKRDKGCRRIKIQQTHYESADSERHL